MDLNAQHYSNPNASRVDNSFKRDITIPQKKRQQKEEHFEIEPRASWFAFVTLDLESLFNKSYVDE